jgi:hypothetical protein
MPFDRVLAITWRNFATLFFIVALVVVPLHVARTYVHRKTIVARELEPDIQNFVEGREVRGVGPEDLDSARRSLLIVTVVEIALIPLAAGAFRRSIQVDRNGGLPKVTDSWLRALGTWRRATGWPAPPAPVIIFGVVLAALLLWLTERIGFLLAEPIPNYLAWAPLGVTEGVARALSSIFFLVPLALLVPRAKAGGGESRPE